MSHVLLLETPHAVSVRRKISGRKCDGDLAVKPRVPRQMNLNHPAPAQYLQDAVMRQICFV